MRTLLVQVLRAGIHGPQEPEHRSCLVHRTGQQDRLRSRDKQLPAGQRLPLTNGWLGGSCRPRGELSSTRWRDQATNFVPESAAGRVETRPRLFFQVHRTGKLRFGDSRRVPVESHASVTHQDDAVLQGGRTGVAHLRPRGCLCAPLRPLPPASTTRLVTRSGAQRRPREPWRPAPKGRRPR